MVSTSDYQFNLAVQPSLRYFTSPTGAGQQVGPPLCASDLGKCPTAWYTAPMSVAVYVHIPFCRRRCAYCDFASVPLAPGALEPYLDALVREGAEAAGSMAMALIVSGFVKTYAGALLAVSSRL